MLLRVALIQPELEGWNFDLRFKKCEKLVKIALKDFLDIVFHQSKKVKNGEKLLFFEITKFRRNTESRKTYYYSR